MIHSHKNPSATQGARKAFTLIELLVVLGIIGLLAAILFPAFRRAQEGGSQANCASNLKQIYQAVELYRQDEKYYPSSLAFLLPNDGVISKGAATTAVDGQACTGNSCPNPGGTGFFKGGRDALVCNNDDTDATLIRSSYGSLSTTPLAPTADELMDMSNYLWNYYGYRGVDGSNCTATNVSECAGTAFQTDDAAYVAQYEAYATASTEGRRWLNDPTNGFNATTNPVALTKLPRLANRFAPTSTIITHCIYHRLPTAGGKISAPFEVTTDPTNGGLARDIVLRRDGSAKVMDISKFHDTTNGNWAKQNF